MGLGVIILNWLAWLLAWSQLRERGQTPWDHRGGLLATHYRVGLNRGLFAGLMLITPAVVKTILSME